MLLTEKNLNDIPWLKETFNYMKKSNKLINQISKQMCFKCIHLI